MASELSDNFETVYPWISNAFFERILRREHQDDTIVVTDYTLRAALAKGENYASQMLRVRVNYSTNKDPSIDHISLIIKAAITKNAEMAAMTAEMGLFRKEIVAFQQVIPEVEKLLRSIGDYSRMSAKCYDASEELSYLVFEDLSASGYVNVNRRTGLDVEHFKHVLTKAAKWHAATAVLIHEGTLSTAPFEESFLVDDSIGDILRNSVMALAEAAQHLPNCQHLVEKLQRLTEKAHAKAVQGGQRNDEEFNALCHGDLWSNNVMFRYDENTGHITHTMLVDFQLGYWTTPVLDVVYALYTSSAAEVTEVDWNELVAVYQEHLERALILSNWPKAIPTLAEIQENRTKRGCFVVAEGIMLLAMRNLEMDEREESSLFDSSESNHAYRVSAILNPKIRENLVFLLEFFDKNGYFES